MVGVFFLFRFLYSIIIVLMNFLCSACVRERPVTDCLSVCVCVHAVWLQLQRGEMCNKNNEQIRYKENFMNIHLVKWEFE